MCMASQCTARSCSTCGVAPDTSQFDAAAIEAAVAEESVADMVEAMWNSRHSRESQYFLYEQLQTLSRTSLRALACGPTCNHSKCSRRPISDFADTIMVNVGELLQVRRNDQHKG